jgi:hypothetical protein
VGVAWLNGLADTSAADLMREIVVQTALPGRLQEIEAALVRGSSTDGSHS